MNQDALAVGDRLARRIDDRGTRRLRENRRGVPDLADIDAAGVHRLEHWRPGGELDPIHRDAGGRQAMLEACPLAGDHQHAVLLVPDAQLVRVRRGESRAP